MRERVTKCKVAKIIPGIWPKTLFCGEFSLVISSFARRT